MATNLVPFETRHAVWLTQYANLAEWREMPQHELQTLKRGEALTLMVGGEIVACGGIVRVWQGFGELWVMTGPLAHKYPVALFKAARLLVRLACDYHRIQATCLESTPNGCKLLEKLGLIHEYTMAGAGPNKEPMRLYAMVTT